MGYPLPLERTFHMKWHWLVAAAACATVPDIASAQQVSLDDGWGPRLRATPFVGWSPGFESAGGLAIFTGGPDPRLVPGEYILNYGPGPMTGLNVEYRLK